LFNKARASAKYLSDAGSCACLASTEICWSIDSSMALPSCATAVCNSKPESRPTVIRANLNMAVLPDGSVISVEIMARG
jgi:hypothetical protein